MNFPVEVYAEGRKHQVVLQDLSQAGMFLRIDPRTGPEIRVGSVVHVAMSPAGSAARVLTAGKVRHALDDKEAETLGRVPGVGIQFRDPASRRDEEFAHAVAQMLDRHILVVPPIEQRIVVADRHTRLLERLSTALGEAGFAVATATNGMEALAACLRHRPDVALVDRAMPVVDGFQVLEAMARQPRLAGIPVMVTSYDASDLVPAFQRGAMDFIPKPFTVDEVILRARRLGRTGARPDDRVILRGALAELGLATLLTMLEQERKTGQLALVRGQASASIDLIDGRIVHAHRAGAPAATRDVVMSLLDWTDGTFELTTGAAPRGAAPELDTPVTHLLLEHARRRDEASRPHRAPRRFAAGTDTSFAR